MMNWLVALVLASNRPLYAQDVVGDWQGTLKVPNAQLRVIVNLAKSDDGGWKTTMYSIDQGVDGIPANSTAVNGSSLKFTVDAIHGSYEGTVSADGASIEGAWTQGRPLPLELARDQRNHMAARPCSAHLRVRDGGQQRQTGGTRLPRLWAPSGVVNGPRKQCSRV